MTDGAELEADRKVRAYVMDQLRRGGDGDLDARVERPEALRHLRKCDTTAIVEADAEIAHFWDTQVTGARFSATLRCSHGVNTNWEWGELGDLPEILDALDEL